MVNTYYVTRIAGSVRRLDDFTLPWVDISVGSVTYNDVMAFPNEPERVIVVGDESEIQVSNDFGATWNTPGGNYQSFGGVDVDFIELWIVNQNVSYAVGKQGVVVKSIDGGLNYNGTLTFPTPSGSADPNYTIGCVHFIDELTGVVGMHNTAEGLRVYKTIDGGDTWTALNAGKVVAPKSISYGIHMSADQTTINVLGSKAVYRTTDSGTTWNQGLDLTAIVVSGSGLHLTWTSDDELWVSGLFDQLWKSTSAGASWSVIRNYDSTDAAIIGAHFYDSVNGFIGGAEIYTTDDAGVNRLGSESFNPPLAVWTEFGPVDPCYVLTDCAEEADAIYTGTDLASLVGQVVTLADENGSEIEGCWFITDSTVPCVDPLLVQDVTVYQCFTECADCLPEPEPIRVPTRRAVQPNYTTGECDPDIVEKAFCAHSDMMLKVVRERRYMIANCCPKDEDKILIQYEKIKAKLCETTDPTPDPCNPLCLGYEIFIPAGNGAVTTYIDCDGEEAEINTQRTTYDVTVRFCALNTRPPVSVVTFADLTTETYILEPTGDCIIDPPVPVVTEDCTQFRLIITASMGGTITYTECNGMQAVINMPGQKSQQEYNICIQTGTVIDTVGAEAYAEFDLGPC